MRQHQHRHDTIYELSRASLPALIGASMMLAATVSVSTHAAESRPIDVAIIESGEARVSTGTLIVERGSTRALRAASIRSVASLGLPNGATIEFLESDGYIDILEHTAIRMPFVAREMLTRWKATPLEIFKALAPGQSAPSALIVDHARRGADSQNTEVRDLAAPPSISYSLNDPGLEPYVCDPWFEIDNWYADWEDAFDGVTAYSASAYIHHFPAFTFYPGAPVYYGTGTNRETYLGACNGTEGVDVLLSIDRWVVTSITYHPSPQPPTVIWGWASVFDTTLVNGDKYTYYSGHPNGRFRGRVEGAGGLVASHQGVAAAWTPSFSVGIAD
jgi:hypothetical protein